MQPCVWKKHQIIGRSDDIQNVLKAIHGVFLLHYEHYFMGPRGWKHATNHLQA